MRHMDNMGPETSVAKPKNLGVDRRKFIKGAVVGAAALATHNEPSAAQPPAGRSPGTVSPTSREAEAEPPSDVQVLGSGERPGADFMVDVFKSLGFDYLCANPGTSFRALHESIIN